MRVGINFLVTGGNFRAMSDMVPLAEGLGVHQLKLGPIHTNLQHRKKPLEEFGNLLFSEDDIDALTLKLEKARRRLARSPLRTSSGPFLAGIPDLYRRSRRFRCFAGYAVCTVNAFGIASPCADMEGSVSVRERPLEEIWRSPEYQELRERVHRCAQPCWDTTYAELSLRLSLRGLLAEFLHTWRDVDFYFRSRES